MSSTLYKVIGVVVGPEKPAALAVVRDLAQWCNTHGIELRAPILSVVVRIWRYIVSKPSKARSKRNTACQSHKF